MDLFRKLNRGLKAIAVLTHASFQLMVQRPRTRPERAAWLSRTCARLLRSMDVNVTAHGAVPMQGAVITNHLSYLDILVHASIRPCVFVSKAEVRSMPVIGWMSMMSGTVYVERGAGGSASKAAEGMAKGFRDGLPVVFFPEGTTGVGDEAAMPFRSGLLAEAMEAGVPVTPGFIRYELAPEDTARGKTPRNDVHWGPQSLISHLWNFLGLHALQVTVHFAEGPIGFSEAAVLDRKVAAEEARQAVLAVHSWPMCERSHKIDGIVENTTRG